MPDDVTAGRDSFVVERSERIEAPPAVVRERIVDFRRWGAWSPWEEVDPQLERTYSGSDPGVGAIYEWSGNRKAGQGRMEITEATDDQVRIDLQFLKPFKSRNTTTFSLRPADGATGVSGACGGRRPS